MEFQKKFLFIDDDADDRDFFCATMERIDPQIECCFAKDGYDALAQIDADHTFIPNYIFIDMNMPRMDGREVLIKIKAIERLKPAQVYIYSTTVNPKVSDEIIELGAAGVLFKPSTMTDLTTLLKKVVGN